MKRLSSDELHNILSLIDSGNSARRIAAITGFNKSTVTRYWEQHRPDTPKSSGGRPSKLSPTDVCHAVRLVTSGEAENAAQVARSLQTITNNSITCQTVGIHLKKAGLKAVVKKKRPLLSVRHRHERLDFATTYLHWTIHDWMHVLWTDEVKFNRLNSDGTSWVYKRAGEGLSDCLVGGTLKFGGSSLMMWGCMSWDGTGEACRILGTLNAELYCQILDDELLTSIEKWGKEPADIIFQQDNDPKHTSRLAQKWLEDHEFCVLKWPAQSPDLNPIEHLWSHIKWKLAAYKEHPKGIEELWERVQAEWDKIEPETCQNLIESMPRRVQAVYKAKGGYTKY